MYNGHPTLQVHLTATPGAQVHIQVHTRACTGTFKGKSKSIGTGPNASTGTGTCTVLLITLHPRYTFMPLQGKC